MWTASGGGGEEEGRHGLIHALDPRCCFSVFPRCVDRGADRFLSLDLTWFYQLPIQDIDAARSRENGVQVFFSHLVPMMSNVCGVGASIRNNYECSSIYTFVLAGLILHRPF